MDIDAVVTKGSRAFVKGADNFGYVQRTSFLGLVHAPVIELDDNTLYGLAGQTLLTNYVVPEQGKTLAEEPFEVPLDVRVSGIAQMDYLGISKETQAAMWTAWVQKLTKEQQQAYVAQWTAVQSSTPEEIAAFVNGMVSALTSLA